MRRRGGITRAERGENAETDHQRGRRQKGDQDEHRQRPGLHQRQRQVFRILDRAVAGARVVQRVHLFVHKRGRQHRDADQRVPAERKPGSAFFRKCEISWMNSSARYSSRTAAAPLAHASQAGLQQDRPGERGIARQRRTEHVGPVDRRAMRGDVARQLGRGAHHRLVVGDSRQHAAFRSGCGGRFARLDRSGLVHHSILCAPLPADNPRRSFRYNGACRPLAGVQSACLLSPCH